MVPQPGLPLKWLVTLAPRSVLKVTLLVPVPDSRDPVSRRTARGATPGSGLGSAIGQRALPAAAPELATFTRIIFAVEARSIIRDRESVSVVLAKSTGVLKASSVYCHCVVVMP